MLTEIEDSLPGSDAATGRRDRDGLPVADLELMT
jgi:hypothetical protein